MKTMTTCTELTACLNTAYALLKDTVESDIYSAHSQQQRTIMRPLLPAYLDQIYSHLVRAVEIERNVEQDLLGVNNPGGIASNGDA